MVLPGQNVNPTRRPLSDCQSSLTSGTLDQRVPVQGSGELAQIAAAFNQMADGIQTKTEALQGSEEYARESEARYRSVVNHVREVIFQTDIAGLWTFLNPSWAEIMGFSLEESVGTQFLDYIHSDDRAQNLALFDPLIRQQKDYCHYEARYIIKAGQIRWIEVYGRPTLNADGTLIGISGTLSDISARRQAEEALTQKNLVLQAQSWGVDVSAVQSSEAFWHHLSTDGSLDATILDSQVFDHSSQTLAAAMRPQPHGQTVPLILLTNHRVATTTEPSETLFTAYLNKPVKQSQLYNVLMRLFGAQLPPLQPSSAQSKLDPKMAARLPLKILLAEDNAVNQKLALLMLERLGYRADIAGNGLEAIAALRRQPYNVVFMDVQMPEMDGLTAARQIRELDRSICPRIIAMTANAMQGDREQCLDAGMDDFTSVNPFAPRR